MLIKLMNAVILLEFALGQTEVHSADYMSFPRMHFSGHLVADVPTTNNFRCAFDSQEFTTSMASRDYCRIKQTGENLERYETDEVNWNPFGSNTFYFQDTTIQSICYRPGQCSTTDEIVGSVFKAKWPGVMADLDVDWQFTATMWALHIEIVGVVEGDVIPMSIQQLKNRNDSFKSNENFKRLARYNSKVTNITWHSSHYRSLFHEHQILSLSLVLDLFDNKISLGRVVGTIGLTSANDPLEITAGRLLQPLTLYTGPAPFRLHQSEQYLTVDLSSSLESDIDGSFSKLIGFKFAVVSNQCKEPVSCTYRLSEGCCKLLKNGGRALIDRNDAWYYRFGGVVDVSLTSEETHLLLKPSYSLMLVSTDDSFHIQDTVLKETDNGIQIGLIEPSVIALNLHDSADFTLFATMHARPLPNVTFSLEIVPKLSEQDCQRNNCFRNLSVPTSVLQIEAIQSTSNATGLARFSVTAVSSPESPRGCDLDGQIYFIRIVASYIFEGRKFNYFVGESGDDVLNYQEMNTLVPVIRVYDYVPSKHCPTWEDVKRIFIQYNNLYPVMRKFGIINLHSYKSVTNNIDYVKYAMFNTSIHSPRYMPSTRDLSRSKADLIKNWISCGMRRSSEDLPSVSIEAIRSLVKSAISVELTTIPPYVTAWLSLKTEYGRNIEVARIIKSVFTEEMNHMTLAANLLNAIGGSVNLLSFESLPQYPTTLGTGSVFDLLPDVMITIEPMSIGYVRDVLTKIETPSSPVEQKIFYDIARLWHLASNGQNEIPKSKNLQKLLDTYFIACNSEQNATIDWSFIKKFADQKRKEISKLPIHSIGSFYMKLILLLSSLEAEIRLSSVGQNQTIFSGNRTFQVPELILKDTDGLPKAYTNPVFPIFTLKDAVEAIVEIVYEGEGSSSCTPFVVNTSKSQEISHYQRFREIVHGRKLIKIQVTEACEPSNCLNLYQLNCSKYLKPGEDYCFAGENIHFDTDGVWPLSKNPTTEMYDGDSKVKDLNDNFNEVYTRMIRCLDDTFTGSPHKLSSCHRDMHNLVIVGKRLVSSPINQSVNGSPTWKFIKNSNEIAGFPLKHNTLL